MSYVDHIKRLETLKYTWNTLRPINILVSIFFHFIVLTHFIDDFYKFFLNSNLQPIFLHLMFTKNFNLKMPEIGFLDTFRLKYLGNLSNLSYRFDLSTSKTFEITYWLRSEMSLGCLRCLGHWNNINVKQEQDDEFKASETSISECSHYRFKIHVGLCYLTK